MLLGGQAVRMDLESSLSERLAGKVDVLIFNPPYVPTPSEEVGSDGIEAAWAGGVDGREVIDRLLPRVANLLGQNGRFYMVRVLQIVLPDDLLYNFFIFCLHRFSLTRTGPAMSPSALLSSALKLL